MTTRTVKRRPRQWHLKRLHKACRSAAVVWLALCDLSQEGESNHVTPTRALLSKMTGIKRLPTITAALTALSTAKWVKIVHVPVTENNRQIGTVLQIKVLHRTNENRALGRKAKGIAQSGHRANEKRALASERKTCADLPTEGARTPPPLDGTTGTASGYAAPIPDTNEHPSAKAERQRLAEIQAKRQAEASMEVVT